MEIEVSYMPQLRYLRAILAKELPNFPYNSCCSAARLVYLALGLEEIAGAYRIPNLDGETQRHAWNRDAARYLDIDITMQQFDPLAAEIVILPVPNNVLAASKKDAQAQRKLKLRKVHTIIRKYNLPCFARLTA